MESKRGREVVEEVAIKHRHSHITDHSALAFAEDAENKRRRAEAEDVEEGEVVDVEQSNGINGHFDIGRGSTNVKGFINEEIRGSAASNQSHGEHQITSYSSEDVKLTEEYDVEKVLKQETHDLFCPNCNSCITKTVILTNKGKVGDIWGNVVVVDPRPPVPPQEPDVIHERKPSFYRCLSCFNIFMCSDWFWRREDNIVTQKVPYEFIDGYPVTQEVPQFSPSQTPTAVTVNKPVTADERNKWVISNIPSEGPSQPHDTFKPVPNGAGERKTAVDETKKWVISNIPSEGPSLPHNTFKPVSNGAGKGKTNAGKDVIIPMHGPGSSQPDDEDAPLLPAVPPSDASAATSRVSGVGIIKAMVYGGLLESIASLSVVSSAAGTNTATLNILALGIANLVGGLCALFHKLRILKHETRSDEYKEAFGEPGHFWLHTSAAVLSYIFFGLLPPVLYAFTFRQTDVRDYKMIAVAVSSLLSVVLLSGGKAHVRSSDQKGYLKTVSYYVSLTVMASGVSFVVGDLLEWLLTELGWFSSAAAWASY